jgi:hypothetical protein
VSGKEESRSVTASEHAVTRFIKRYRRDLSSGEARDELERLAAGARHMGPTVGGELYEVDYAASDGGSRIPFVVRRDPKVGDVIVTVLPPRATMPPAGELEEVVDAYRRLTGYDGADVAHLSICAVRASSKTIAAAWAQAEMMRAKEAEASIRRDCAQRPKTESTRLRDHAERLAAESRKMKLALKAMLRSALAGESVDAALAEVRAIDPGLLTPAFWSGVAAAPEERRRQAAEARGVADE